jgi:hypothetical protein
MCDSPAADPNGNQDGLEPISKFLARHPSGVHKTEIVNFPQFHLETFEQFVRGVVQLRVAELHVKPLAGEFDGATPSMNSEQEQVASIQGRHQDESRLSLGACCKSEHRAPDQRLRHRQFVSVL